MELEAENWRLCSTTLVRGWSSLAAESSLAAALAPLQLSHVSRPPGSREVDTHTETHALPQLTRTL